jgi:hypothetical protein
VAQPPPSQQPPFGTSEPGSPGESNVPSPPRRRHTRAIWTVVAIVLAVIVVIAGVSYYSDLTTRSAARTPTPPPGWTTFEGAWDGVSSAFSAFGNGTWNVSFAEGVAADGHWSPPATLWALYWPAGWMACEAQLSGISTLTFWNASEYPSTEASTDFSSGAAPLWTFIFSQAGTPTFVASWFLGKIALNAALGPGSACLQYSIFNATVGLRVVPGEELDSNAIANEVQQEDDFFSGNPPQLGGPAPMPTPPTPGVALYFPGLELLPGEIFGPSSWSLAYTTCGLEGFYGSLSSFTTYILNATTLPQGHTYQWSTTTGSCYDAIYFVDFNRTAVMGAPSHSGQYFEWTLNVSFMTSAIPAFWDLSDLTTSLSGVRLASIEPPFGNLSSAAELCGPGSSNLSSCPAPTAGWYAVLLSHNGTWLDSYPTSPNGTDWALSNIPIQTGDMLAFVGSSGYGSTDSLGLTSANEPWVFGGDDLEGP